MLTVFGIPNCDTVKKSRAWLEAHAVAYVFVDFKKGGVPADALAQWVAALGWQALINKKGGTWRQLGPAAQAAVVDAASAQAVMLAHPSVIKRPVVVARAAQAAAGTAKPANIYVGYQPDAWAGSVS